MYNFYLETEHDVPLNGRIRITAPSQCPLTSYDLENNCYRLGDGTSPTSLDCDVNVDGNYFDVIVRSSTFGSNGLTAGEEFAL